MECVCVGVVAHSALDGSVNKKHMSSMQVSIHLHKAGEVLRRSTDDLFRQLGSLLAPFSLAWNVSDITASYAAQPLESLTSDWCTDRCVLLRTIVLSI